MNKEKILNFLATAFLVMVCLAVMLPQVLSVDTSSLDIVVEGISPATAEPGHDMTIKVRVYNNGGAEAKDVSLNLSAPSQFGLKGDTGDPIKSLCVLCSKEKTFYLSVADTAISGDYPIVIYAYEKNTRIAKNIVVRVQGKPDIVFRGEKPENVRPKDSLTVRLDFDNIGTGTARNIKIFPVSSEFVSLGSGMQVIPELQPGEEKSLDFTFNVAENVAPNSYNLPFAISFTDDNGNTYNITQNFGMNVVHGAVISLQSLKVDGGNQIYVGDKLDLQARVENVGKGSAENVRVTIEADMSGTKTAYIGRIQKDDDSPAFFTLYPKTAGSMPVKVIISYRDDFGMHNVTEVTAVDVSSKKSTNMLFVPVSVVLFGVVGTGAFFIRKRK